jgi:hypothetical protein
MAFRFRRTMKIAPGVRLNIGKRGGSISIGRRGASMTLGGSRGATVNLGLPGTGLSMSQRVGSPTPAPRPSPVIKGETSVSKPSPATGRLTVWQSSGKIITISAGLFVLLVFPPLGALIVLVGLFIPSRKKALQKDLSRRLESFKAEFTKGESIDDIDRIFRRQRELGLSDEQVGQPVIDTLRGARALLVFEQTVEQNSGKVPALLDHATAVAPDACFFAAPSVHDKRGSNDPSGTLYLTNERALFVSNQSAVAVPWSKTIMVGREDSRLFVQRTDRETPFTFVLPSIADAMKAEWIGKNARANKMEQT